MPWRKYRADNGLEVHSLDIGPLHATVVDSGSDVVWSIDVGRYHTAFVAARTAREAKHSCLQAMKERSNGYRDTIEGLEREL